MVRNAHSLKLDLRLFSRDRTVPSLKMLKPSIEKVKLVLPVAATAEPPADYDRLNLYRYSSTPASLAAEVSWTFDTATWTLNSGRLWVQEPIADGTLTGFVFEGEGRFVMEIPNPYELAQLRRFCNNKELQRLDYRFTRLVVRGSNLSQLPLELTPPSAPQPLNLPRNRHEFWLRQYLLDANARTLVALRNRASRVPAHRDADRRGRLGGLGKSVGGGAGRSGTQGHKTRFDAGVQFKVAQQLGAVRLYLHPYARVDRVSDGNGRELEFVRDRIGNRATALDNRLHDPELAVFLAEPVSPGGTLELHVEYEMEIANFVSGLVGTPHALLATRVWSTSTPPGSR